MTYTGARNMATLEMDGQESLKRAEAPSLTDLCDSRKRRLAYLHRAYNKQTII